jgi:hypothetical protein
MGSNYVGGLAGYNTNLSSTIINSYAIGNVTGTGSSVGGLVGSNASSTISNSYYSRETTGAGSYGTSKTEAELKQQSTFIGWDFAETWAIGAAINKGYPHLRGIKFNYDMSTVKFENKAVAFNGETHSILISGTLPEDITVEYVGNYVIDAGTYTVTANFATSNVNYNVPASLMAVLTIACTSGETWQNDNCVPTPIRIPQIATASNILAHATNNTIILQNLPANAKVEVFNLQGRSVLHKPIMDMPSRSIASNVLTIPVQAKGIYIVKVSMGSERKMLRVAVK